MSQPTFLGVLSDSVRTRAILADASGRELARSTVEHARFGHSRELFEEVLTQTLAGQETSQLVAAVALPQLLSPAHRRSAAELLRRVFPSHSRVLLCDRWEAALAGSLGSQSGVLVFCGREAAVARADAEGNFARVEASPELLGGEGSGLWLGTRTLQMAARMAMGRMPVSERLEAVLTSHFGFAGLEEFVAQADVRPLDPEQVTALGTRVVELAAYPEPDPACRALVLQAARRLGQLIENVIGPEEGELVASHGGQTLHGTLLEEIRKTFPQLRFQPPKQDELEGSLQLARAGANLEDPEGDEVGRQLWSALLEGVETQP